MTAPGDRYPGTGATSLGGSPAASGPRSTFADIPPDETARASFGPRVRAALLDGSLIAMPLLLAALVAIAGPQRRGSCVSTALDGSRTVEACTVPTTSTLAVAGLVAVAGVALAAWYLCLYPRRRGATLGKRWQGIIVVDATSRRPAGPAVLLRRELVRVGGAIVTLGFFAVFDHLRPLWNDRGQSIHDQVAGTVVISEGTVRP